MRRDLEMAARQVLEHAKRCPPDVELPKDGWYAYGCAVSPNRSFVLVAKRETVVRVDLAMRKVMGHLLGVPMGQWGGPHARRPRGGGG